MVHYKTDEEVALIRLSSLLVGKTLAEVARRIRPGVSTQWLDRVAEEFIRDNGGAPSFKGYNGFPSCLCISINREVVHGIPSARELSDGDIASVDCGVLMNGFHGDSAFTFEVGEVSGEVSELLKATRAALEVGISMAVEGNKMGDLSHAIQEYAEKRGYGVVRELVGHGVGRSLHGAPEVPNYGKKGSGILLKEGLVLAIEPMINMGTRNVKQLKDGWTIVTADGKPSAHFEHTLVVRKEKAEVLSTFDFIDEVLQNRT